MKSKINLNQLLGRPFNVGEKFQFHTKIKKIQPEIDQKKWPKEWKTTYFKTYPRLDQIILPDPQPLNKAALNQVLFGRHSTRQFSQTSLTLEQISSLLYFSAGLANQTPPLVPNRFYPSAGSRYPLEVYLLSLNSDLPMGVYHYNLKQHGLETINQIETFDESEYFINDWVKSSGVLIMISAVFIRNTMKYGDRGYRYIYIESGHLGQNLYLVATVMGLNICSVGGFADDKLNKLVDLNGYDESLIYVLGVGQAEKK